MSNSPVNRRTWVAPGGEAQRILSLEAEIRELNTTLLSCASGEAVRALSDRIKALENRTDILRIDVDANKTQIQAIIAFVGM